MRYRFTCDYKSGYGQWKYGEEVEFDDETAAWLLRDVAGCIEPVTEPEARAMEKPPRNRQVTSAPRKRGA